MGLEERYIEVKKLIDMGKEKGYLLYDELSDILPPEIIASAEDLDDLFAAFGTAGIEVIETEDQSSGADKLSSREKGKANARPGEVELDLTPGTQGKTNDPVRMYLREMGTVRLLTRAGEVEIAKRIERGQLRVMQSLSRSPIIIRAIIELGDALRKDPSVIKDLVRFSEEDLTEDKVEQKHTETLEVMAAITRMYRRVNTHRTK